MNEEKAYYISTLSDLGWAGSRMTSRRSPNEVKRERLLRSFAAVKNTETQ